MQKLTNDESNPSSSSSVASVAAEAAADQDGEDKDGDAKKKKNRCAVCRKKVGLTGECRNGISIVDLCVITRISLFSGFECRCGGLFCAMHRYSDKHECTFDYRSHGQQEIRRNNPVVVGEKIQKI